MNGLEYEAEDEMFWVMRRLVHEYVKGVGNRFW